MPDFYSEAFRPLDFVYWWRTNQWTLSIGQGNSRSLIEILKTSKKFSSFVKTILWSLALILFSDFSIVESPFQDYLDNPQKSILKSLNSNKLEQDAFFKRSSLCLNAVSAATEKQSPSLWRQVQKQVVKSTFWTFVLSAEHFQGDYVHHYHYVHCTMYMYTRCTMYIALNFEEMRLKFCSIGTIQFVRWIEPLRLELVWLWWYFYSTVQHVIFISINFRAILMIWNSEMLKKVYPLLDLKW